MKLAIHASKNGFPPRWIAYCETNNIPYKLVDCYHTDIIKHLEDCDALMWHINHLKAKDYLFAKQLLFSVESAGKAVFPNFKTGWHFDDKLGQKYLFEAMGAPFVPTWAFYSKKDALDWASKTTFPKVFKLRGGAGSANVRLARTKSDAESLISQAFGSGFASYDRFGSLKERYRKYKMGKAGAVEVLKGLGRIAVKPDYARTMGSERAYIYFQEYIPGNDCDIRIIVVGEKAFALKRMVRENDFRASGSGDFRYAREEFSEETIRLSFEYARKLQSQCAAFDFVYLDGKPLFVEISFGFVKEVYDPCVGYWDKDLNFHPGQFDPCAWMVQNLVDSVKK
jgi:glutathione synthase/RimK-type ligase-like ATP-grasp enzyme